MMGQNNQDLTFRKKILTFIMMNLALVASYSLFTLPSSFLPLYNLDREINLTITGTILAAVPLCYVIVCPIAAWLLNNYSSRKILLASLGMISCVTVVFSMMGYIYNDFWYIIATTVLRIIQGLAGGIVDVTAFAITGAMFADNLALTTAIVESSLNVAIASAPFCGALLYENLDFLWAFLVPAGLVGMACLLSLFCVSDVDCKSDSAGWSSIKEVLKDGLILFAGWHSAFAQTLLNYYIPVLAAYTHSRFGKGPIFAGICLLVNTAGIVLCSPFLGYFMDRFNPYFFFVFSAITLPITYLFIGPATYFQVLVAPSPRQLLTVLGLIGIQMPMACYPSLIIMLDVYKVRYGTIPQEVRNFITSLYCASFPLGACLGVFVSGVMAKYYDFVESVTIMGYLATAESLFLFIFCILVRRTKNIQAEEETYLLQTDKSSYG